MTEQVVINSAEFARNGERLEGRVAVGNLGRLQDLLFSSDGYLTYALTGRSDENGRFYLSCIVKGVLQLVCQRCLGAYPYTVGIDSELELLQDSAEAAESVDEDVLTDAIEADPRLDVLALVEDEILLGLPMAPMHDLETCQSKPDFDPSGSGKQNAFGALAALKMQNLRK